VANGRTLNLGTIFTADITALLNGIQRARQAVLNFNQQLQGMGRGSQAFAQAGRNVQGATQAIQRGHTALGQYARAATRVTGVVNRMSLALKTVATYGIATSGIYGLMRAFAAGAKEIVDFDQALKNLQAITRATDAEVMGMGETIKQVAKDTKFSTAEVADGMVLLGQAGFSATESMQAMSAVANLATGTLGDMTDVADLVTTSIRAWNLSTVESSRVSDVMANAVNRSKLTIDKLRTAFNYVGAASAQAGIDIEEAAASMGVLANNGLRASTIGTGLRQVISRLLSPSRNLREEFRSLGIDLNEINPRLVGYQKAMENLSRVMQESEAGTVDMAKAYRLFGLRGAQAVAVLSKAFGTTGPGSFQDMLNKVYETGSAADMASTQMEGLGVKLKNLADRAKLIAVAFGEAGVTDSLKVLVDVLRSLASVIAQFISSSIGKFLTSITVWVASLTLLGVSFTKLGQLLLKLGPIIVKFANDLKKALIVMNLIQGSSIAMTASVARLVTIMRSAAAKIGLLFAAIGAGIAVFNWFRGSTQRAIDVTIKLDQKMGQTTQTLALYAEKFDKLAEKYKKGENVQRQHESTIKRVEAAYSKLSGQLDLNSEKAEENAQKIREALSVELETKLQNNIKTLELYRKKLEEVAFWQGLLNRVSKGWDALLTILDVKYRNFIDNIGKNAEVLGKAFEIIIPKGMLDILRDDFKLIGEYISEVSEYYKKLGRDTKEYEKTQQEMNDQWVATGTTLYESKLSFEEIRVALIRLGATKDQVELVITALEALKQSSKEIAKNFKENLSDMPEVFRELYDQLSAESQVALIDSLANMDKEIEALKKKAEDYNIEEEKIAKNIMAIRAKTLVDFIEKNEKEKMSLKERADWEIKILDSLAKQVEKTYQERTKGLESVYEKEKELAENNASKLKDIQKDYTGALLRESQARKEELIAIEQAKNDVLEDLARESSRKQAEAWIDLAKDYKTELKSIITESKSKFRELSRDLKKFRKEHSDNLREIRQRDFSDEQKYNDDISRINKLMNEARAKHDYDTYKQAYDLAEGLAREVKDSSGETVRDLRSTSDEAESYMKRIANEIEALYKNQREATKKQAQDAQSDIEKLDRLIDAYGKKIDDVSRKELVLQTEQALQDLDRTYQLVDKFQEKWDQIESKEITLKVKITQEGGVPAIEGGEEPQLGSGEYIRTDEGMAEGGYTLDLIRRLKKKQRQTRKYGSGGSVIGARGIDKIAAWLSHGEYVMRSEAVKKYGTNFMSSINSMTVPVESATKVIKARMGGLVKSLAPRYEMQPEFATPSPINRTYNITVSPQFLTGDRNSMRKLATEVKKAIENVDKGLGKNG